MIEILNEIYWPLTLLLGFIAFMLIIRLQGQMSQNKSVLKENERLKRRTAIADYMNIRNAQGSLSRKRKSILFKNFDKED